ncbi:MAG TPA: FKBP-type peptidyl-prolyl cis-trans isomerase [Conexivisphaerales archaeon]|nr:FKBP-type peptidyl-prolyl cis-trans isomerase [Conexivisphaerales archaeon]
MDSGTLAYINYVAKVKDNGEVLEATREEDAKSLGIFNPVARYTPTLVAVGEGWVLKGLDDALLNAKVGEKLNVEITPDKGFGERDPTKIKLIPEKRFGEKAHELAIGAEVEVEGKVGVVRYIGSGRVQVDFNHRLAGKVLTYDVEVVKAVTEPVDITKALLLRRLPLSEDKLNVVLDLDKGTATVNLPMEVYYVDGLQFIKRAASNDVFKFVKKVNTLSFTEEYKAPEPPKPKEEPKPAEAKPTEGEKKEEAAPEAKPSS